MLPPSLNNTYVTYLVGPGACGKGTLLRAFELIVKNQLFIDLGFRFATFGTSQAFSYFTLNQGKHKIREDNELADEIVKANLARNPAGLLSNDLTNRTIARYLKRKHIKHLDALLVDGYVRDVGQAETVIKNALNANNFWRVRLGHIHISIDTALTRAQKRSLEAENPRPDDQPGIVRDRYRIYETNVLPAIHRLRDALLDQNKSQQSPYLRIDGEIPLLEQVRTLVPLVFGEQIATQCLDKLLKDGSETAQAIMALTGPMPQLVPTQERASVPTRSFFEIAVDALTRNPGQNDHTPSPQLSAA